MIKPCALLIFAILFADQSRAQQHRMLNFFRDDGQRRWCFDWQEARFKDLVRSVDTSVGGAITYSGGALSQIVITELDETGDWTLKDEYSFDRSGRIQRIKRTISILPDDLQEEQEYRVQAGRATRIRTTFRELRTKKTVSRKKSLLSNPGWQVYGELKAFPFPVQTRTAPDEANGNPEWCVPSGTP